MNKIYALGLSVVVAGLLTGCIGGDDDGGSSNPKAVLIYQHVGEDVCQDIEDSYNGYGYEYEENVDVVINYTSHKECSDYGMEDAYDNVYDGDYDYDDYNGDFCMTYDYAGGDNGSCVIEMDVENYYGSYAPKRMDKVIEEIE